MIIAPEKHIYLRLVSNPAVARAVGFQVYPVAVPKGAGFPFIVYRRSNISRESSLGGPMFTPMLSLQVASWGLTHEAARSLADDVRLCLDGYTGTMQNSTIQSMRLTSETDDYLDPTQVGAQLPPAYEVRQLYQIHWSEAMQ